MTKRTFKIADCATNAIEWEGGFRGMHLVNDLLVVNTFYTFYFLNVSDPLNAQVLSKYPSRFSRTTKTKVVGESQLACFSDEGFETIDFSNPKSLRVVTSFENKNAPRYGVPLEGGLLTAEGEKLVSLDLESGETKVLAEPAEVKEKRRTHEGDIAVLDDMVMFTDGSRKLHVYQRNEKGYRHLKSIRSGSFSPFLAFDTTTSLLNINDGKVARVDFSNPSKIKRLKSRSLGSLHTGDEWVRIGDDILLAGLDGKDRLVIVTLDASDDTLPIISKQVVDGFVSRDHCSDTIRGIVFTGTHLLVSSFARRLYVLELL